MLLTKLRFELTERMSVQTMRYVSAVPRAKADGLVARIYDMIAEDFFINGSLTGHSKVPPKSKMAKETKFKDRIGKIAASINQLQTNG